MNPLAIPMPSQRKLNTYGVESPCERSPGVGSFLANPGLSKEQLVPSCVVSAFVMWRGFIEILARHSRRCIVVTFTMVDVFIKILAQHLWRYVVKIFIMADIFIEIFSHFAIYLFVC